MGTNEKSHIKVQSKRKPSWLERLKDYFFPIKTVLFGNMMVGQLVNIKEN